MPALARDRRAGRRLRALARASVGDVTQGRAFIDTARAAWSCDGLDEVIAACGGPVVLPRRRRSRQRGAWHSARTGAARLPARGGLQLDFRGARLIPLGQTNSQRVLAQLEPDGGRDGEARDLGLA